MVQIPNLSEEAKELLINTAKDPQGKIFTFRVMGGEIIQTNNLNFGDPLNPRTIALFKSAIKELLNFGLVENLFITTGEGYKITKVGYEIADLLLVNTNIKNIEQNLHSEEEFSKLKQRNLTKYEIYRIILKFGYDNQKENADINNSSDYICVNDIKTLNIFDSSILMEMVRDLEKWGLLKIWTNPKTNARAHNYYYLLEDGKKLIKNDVNLDKYFPINNENNSEEIKMSNEIKKLNIFIASASDTNTERNIAEETINEIREIFESCSIPISLTCKRWEKDLIPSAGDPQKKIDDNLLYKCDILIGIFKDSLGKGTEAEINKAIEKYSATQKPEIMIYFYKSDKKPRNISDRDINGIDKLKEQFENKNVLFYSEFKNNKDFGKKIRIHLWKYILTKEIIYLI